MTDSNPSSASPASGCCTPSGGACCPPGCCPSPCCCPCAPRIAKLEKTVCRIRTGLLIALGVLVLLIGIAIGKGGDRREMREEFRVIERHGPGPMGGPMHGPMGGGPRRDRGDDRRDEGRDDRRDN